MKTLYASVAIAAALMSSASSFALSWQSVVPKGNDYCTKDINFRTNHDDDIFQQLAAKSAKSRFCNVVRALSL